jgi:hypothetical protein
MVLPEPLSPTIPNVSPSPTDSETSSGTGCAVRPRGITTVSPCMSRSRGGMLYPAMGSGASAANARSTFSVIRETLFS